MQIALLITRLECRLPAGCGMPLRLQIYLMSPASSLVGLVYTAVWPCLIAPIRHEVTVQSVPRAGRTHGMLCRMLRKNTRRIFLPTAANRALKRL
jgi:hypothetical protein